MTARPAAAALVLAAVLAAGCGSATPTPTSGSRPAAEVRAPGSQFLATSLTSSAGTWAVAVMGGSAATHNNFWQLFVRPAGSSRWRLVTPPGVADNGGLVLADAGGAVVTAFRPSQYLNFTPLTLTRDGGQAWSSTGPLDAGLANVPDALAAAPASGHLLALLADGTAKQAAPGYTRWHTLATRPALAATPAGRRCGLSSLTAATFTPSGLPLLAGGCARPGTAGIFTTRGGTWQAAGPALPATVTGQRITVLRLTRTASGVVALLRAGSAQDASVLAAWLAGGSRWQLSPPVRLGGAALTSSSFGPTGAVTIIVNGNRAQTITGAGTAWQSLPQLPAGTATVTSGAAGGFDALAVHRTRLTVWRLGAGPAAWRAAQVLNVPIQFGSSG